MDYVFDLVLSGVVRVLTFTYSDVSVWQVLVFALVLHYLRLAWQHEKFLRKSFRYEWAYLKAQALGKKPERRRWGGSFGTTPDVIEKGQPIGSVKKHPADAPCMAEQSVGHKTQRQTPGRVLLPGEY